MKLFEIAVRAFSDVRADATADAVFLYSQTADNQSSVLSAAKQLLEEGRVKRILITNSGPKSGYPGYAAWQEALVGMGVPKSAIQGVDLKKEASLNTLIESNALVQHTKLHRYNTLYVTASPFHQVRAFMTAITAAQNYYPQIKLHSFNGHPLPWLQSVAHSQGETTGSRTELINAEFERILKYQKKGDLALDEDILTYLNERDR